MMNNTRRKLTVIGASIALALSTSPALALTLYYDAFGGFENDPAPIDQWDTFADTVVYGGYTEPLDNSTGQVAWGTPTGPGGPYDGKSYMGINEWSPANAADQPYKYAPGDRATPEPRLAVNTKNPIGSLLGDLTHFNFPIAANGGDQGWTTVDYHLHLYPTANAPEAGRLFDLHMQFVLDLWETLNTEPCPNNAPAGTEVAGAGVDAGLPGTVVTNYPVISDGVGGAACADAHTFSALDWFDVGSFIYNDINFTVQASGFYDGTGPDAKLTSTFWSDEGASSHTAYVRFRVVPEPGTIALLGAGLMGLGYSKRRKQKHSA